MDSLESLAGYCITWHFNDKRLRF